MEFKKAKWWSALLLEQYFAEVIAQQEDDGFQFNTRRADRYISYLTAKCDQLYNEIRPHLSYRINIPYRTPVDKPFTKAGDYSSINKKWMGENVVQVGGVYTRVEFLEPDLNSEKQLKEQLFRLGWVPDEWNYKKDEKGKVVYDGNKNPIQTSPKLTESSYTSLTVGIGPIVAEYLKASMRLSSIKGWLSRVRKDGTISARGNTIGTPTMRMRHSGVVNVPKNDDEVYFGKQCRSLFTHRPDRILCGWDAKGLESRMEAHETYPISKEYALELIHGDVHQKNGDKWGIERNTAKGGKYALTYGAYPPKLSKTLGLSKRKATEIFNSFWSDDNPLHVLKKRLEIFWKRRKFIWGLDRRKIYVRKQSDLLNYRFQSNGAIVMKWSMVWLDKQVKAKQLDAIKVIDMHDEGQADVDKKDVIVFSSLAIQSIREAGKYYKLNIPLDADASVGPNWAHTH